jgi:hypothetical protein
MRNLYFLIAFTLLSCGDFSKEIERQRAEKLKEQREEELKKTDETREKILNFIKSKIKVAEAQTTKNTPEEVSKYFQSILKEIHQVVGEVIKIEEEINRITQIQHPSSTDQEELKELKEKYKNILSTDNKQ